MYFWSFQGHWIQICFQFKKNNDAVIMGVIIMGVIKVKIPNILKVIVIIPRQK